jgi:hypothetical protein
MSEPIPESRKETVSKWDDLFFGVKRTVRYHLHRRKFFGAWKVITKFLVIASGGTVISIASSEPKKIGWMIFVGAITALIGTLDLVLDFSDKAREHRDLVAAFSDLEAQMVADAVAKERLVEFTNKRLKLEVDEPPIKQVLNNFCHNELVIAEDYPLAQLADIKWWQSWSKQYFDWCPERVKTFKQIETETARLAREKAEQSAIAARNAAQIQV